MPCRNIFKIALVISFFCTITPFTNTPVRAQTREKPQLKDFGSSIQSKKEQNNKQSKNNTENKNDVSSDDDVIKVDTLLVRTDVLVADRRGKAISGLRAEDFIITENDVPQEIGTFSLGESVDVPKSIVLIIDYSASQIPFIKNSVEAAKVLVDKLNPRDRMAIVTDDIELLQRFTGDKKSLKKKLDSLAKVTQYEEGKIPKTGKSLQYSALMASLKEMFDEEDIRPIIIFQTDGDEVFSVTAPSPESAYTRLKTRLGISFTAEEFFSRIEKSRAIIYSVISDYSMLGLSPNERIAKITDAITKDNKEKENKYKSLRFILAPAEDLQGYTERLFKQQTAMMIVARNSGGFTESLETPEQADEIYMRILNDINNRYLLGYYPKNEKRDGKRRNVKIEVRGHPEYVVWGRKTYMAPGAEK